MTDRALAAPFHAAVMRHLTAQGRSVLWLSKRTGVSRTTISRWRTQPQPPQPRTVIAVADALSMDVDGALRLAGVTGETAELGAGTDLSKVATADLVAEIQRLLTELQRRIPPD